MSSTTCTIQYCMVTSVTEPKITCYGPCQIQFHAICLGIHEVCIDKFRDPTSGFKYICLGCRDISIASISKEFKRMEMGFKALRSKFLSFEKSSPEVSNSLNLDDSPVIGLPVKRSAKEMGELTVPAAKKISTLSSTAKVKDVAFNRTRILVDPLPPTSLGSTATASSSSNTAPPQLLASVPSPSRGALKPASEVALTVVPAGNQTTDVGLTAIPKPKSVFISRLSPTTTVQQVTNHIGLKFGGCNALKVKKLTTKRNPISSFKIDVSPDMLDSLLQTELWPEGAFVNIFEDRSMNKVGRLNNKYRKTNKRTGKKVTSSNVPNPKN